jgi:hypothetical protein
MVLCPKCGCEYALPVEPLYYAESVCALVPVKRSQLQSWMGRNPGVLSPPKYTGPRTRSRRLFTADDIRLLRAALVRPRP